MIEENVITAAQWIARLSLTPHPEGGFYKEVFRSAIPIVKTSSALIKQACTSIYYLLEGKDYSGFHRLASDEIWYFHKGLPLLIHVINKEGAYSVYELSDTASGNLSVVIEAGLWFAAEVAAQQEFTLVSCVVAPGFEFSEFEMAKQEDLVARYPQHTEVLTRLCRD